MHILRWGQYYFKKSTTSHPKLPPVVLIVQPSVAQSEPSEPPSEYEAHCESGLSGPSRRLTIASLLATADYVMMMMMTVIIGLYARQSISYTSLHERWPNNQKAQGWNQTYPICKSNKKPDSLIWMHPHWCRHQFSSNVTVAAEHGMLPIVQTWAVSTYLSKT